MLVTPRSAWAPTDAMLFSRALNPSRVKGMVLHYPGDSVAPRGEMSFEAVARMWRAYDRYHRTFRGWPGIGYLLGFDQNGRAWSLAGAVVGAHSATSLYPGANHERVGAVLLLGNYEAPSEAMRGAVRSARLELQRGTFPGFPALPGMVELHGHGDMLGASTSCPGEEVEKAIRSGAFSGDPGTPTPPVVVARYAPGEVMKIKRLLYDNGFYGGAIDDRDDPWFRASVANYQVTQNFPQGGLKPDGWWGPRTAAHADWVGLLQRTLNQWKTQLPPLRIDRDFGDLTTRRVVEMQSRNDLVADGRPGPITCGVLGIPTHP